MTGNVTILGTTGVPGMPYGDTSRTPNAVPPEPGPYCQMPVPLRYAMMPAPLRYVLLPRGD